MKKLFVFLLANLLLTTCALAQNGNTLQLAKDGKTSYVIALANDAIPAEKTAAQQFQKYFQQITGAPIIIQSEDEVNAAAPQILIAAGERVKVLLPEQNWKSLGADGIVIKTIGNKLILAGGRPRGTLYAVFQFLEDVAGCNWWTPTESTIPYKSTFNVPPQNTVYVPPFNYREHYTTAVRKDPVFATIMRENGDHQTQTSEWGGHYSLLGWAHSFSKLLPPKKYFKQHPEWYSDQANGNKPGTAASKMPEAQDTQLCLSNPQVLDEITKQALAWIEENPDAGYISISQNDNQNYCRDTASMELAKQEGSQAAPLLKFVNEVAKRIHQHYPDFKVETLAYQYTVKPPKTIRPAKNVVIRLAPIFADFGHPLNSDWNAKARENVLAWSKIAPQLFVWNYVTNFSGNIFPHPNWLGLSSDLRFFASHNVKGIFEQGDSYTNGVGDFVQLRTWLIAHLMWNPERNQEKLTSEFLQGYYGAAAPYLKQYLDLIQQSFLAQDRQLSTFNYDFSFIDLDTANQSIRLFDQAEAAVKDNPALLHRVQRERLSISFGILYRYNVLRQESARTNTAFLGPQDPNAAMTDFIEAAKSLDMSRWKEGKSFKAQIPNLQRMFAPPQPLPDFAKVYPPQDVVDLRSPVFRLYRSGSITQLEKDTAASGGIAASILGTTNQWGIQVDLSRSLDTNDDQWHIYAMARVEINDGTSQTGAGFQSGIYDVTNRELVNRMTIPLQDVAGSVYQRVDLGVHQLNGGMYIWFAPTRNPAVKKVYVDRIILIREP